jgi:hypothetical protein
MTVRTKPLDHRDSPVPFRRPSPRARALYFLGGLPLALLVIALSQFLGWSMVTMLEVGAVAGALYVLVATPLLLGRRR